MKNFLNTMYCRLSKPFFTIFLLSVAVQVCASDDFLRVAVFPSKTVLLASDLPYTITQPGIYVLAEDVDAFTGTTPAISVVTTSTLPTTIDLCNHFIQTSTIAISATGPTQIQNGILITAADTALASGLITAAQDVIFTTTIATANGAGIGIAGTGNLVHDVLDIDHCTFRGLSIGLLPDATLNSINSTNNLFVDCFTGCRVLIGVSAGSEIKNCVFQGTLDTAIQLNNTGIWNINNCAIENSLVNHISASMVTDLLINNCDLIISGTSIALADVTRFLMRNSIVAGSVVTGVDLGTSLDAIIYNTTFNRGVAGIVTSPSSLQQVIKNCSVRNMTGTGILIRGSNTLLQSCQVDTCGIGIDISSATNAEVFNCTSLNNTGADYVGLSPLLISADDADTVTAGFFFRNISR